MLLKPDSISKGTFDKAKWIGSNPIGLPACITHHGPFNDKQPQFGRRREVACGHVGAQRVICEL